MTVARAVVRLLLLGAAAASPVVRPARAQRVREPGVPAGVLVAPADSATRSTPSGVRWVPVGSLARSAAATSGFGRGRAAEHPGWAPVASAALPGGGQAMLGQNRFVAYVALEAYAWLQYVSDSREGRRQRSAYRALARNVARSTFASDAPVGSWEYYERMEHFVESGVYDAVPGGAIEPEPDTLTYNGSVWLLARQTYWADPEVAPDAASDAYRAAVTFYRQRAVTPSYRWSWRDAQLEQDLFRRTIARSNDAYRRAAQDLAVVIGNHVLSTVDAYATVRLRARRPSPTRAPAPADGGAYGLSVSLPLPRLVGGAWRP